MSTSDDGTAQGILEILRADPGSELTQAIGRLFEAISGEFAEVPDRFKGAALRWLVTTCAATLASSEGDLTASRYFLKLSRALEPEERPHA